MIAHVRRIVLAVLVAVLTVQTVAHVDHVAGVSRTEHVSRPAGLGYALASPVRRDVSSRILRDLDTFVPAGPISTVRVLANDHTDSRFAPRSTSTYPTYSISIHLTI